MKSSELRTLARTFLRENGGSAEFFDAFLNVGKRPGQAFFNALSSRHQEMVQASDVDPFYDDEKIPACIEFLKVQDYQEIMAREEQARAATNHD